MARLAVLASSAERKCTLALRKPSKNRIGRGTIDCWHMACCFGGGLERPKMMNHTDNTIKLLTIAEAAIILKISKRTLHRMIQHKQIPAFKVGGQWRILESRFNEWVHDEENTAPKTS
jgi:excisionase family DNA binding protein